MPFPWYFLALLEYLKIDPTLAQIETLARSLNTTTSEITETVSRFISNGWVLVSADGYKVEMQKGVAFLNPPITNAVAKDYQKKYIEKSATALQEVEFERRLHMGHFFRLSQQKIPALRAAVNSFLSEVTWLANQKDDSDKDIYCIQLGAFPLLKNEKSRGPQ